MTAQEDKEIIIRQIYVHETGFDSIYRTYQKAKAILNTTTFEDVIAFLATQKINQQTDYRGYNSYVANEPLQEIQIDLGIFKDSADNDNGYIFLFVAIYVFTKYVCVIPIKDKPPNEVVRALNEVFETIRIPKQICHDNERSFNSLDFIILVNLKTVKKYNIITAAVCGERYTNVEKCDSYASRGITHGKMG